MIGNESPIDPFLNLEDIQKIERSDLSIIEKHHLRLMAHCLASFKSMTNANDTKDFPSDETLYNWCAKQASLEEHQTFIPLLVNQFAIARSYLNELAKTYETSLLEITLDNLIQYSIEQRES